MIVSIRLVISFLTCMGALFAYSNNFVDSCLLPKWFIMIIGLLLICSCSLIHFLIKKNKGNSKHNNLVLFGIIIIVVAVLSQAIYGILQYMGMFPSGETFKIVGSFDNPAGFAASLCAGLPFCILGILQTRGWLRRIFSLALITVIAVIVLSESRAGILSIMIIAGYWLWKHIQLLSKIKKILFLILLVGIVAGLYYYKKDSADGRLLIWKCSMPLFQENILAGGGRGTFVANYMDYQASFFKMYPDSSYSILADNIQYPFCEYLNLGINFGIVGLSILFCIIGYMFRCFYKDQTQEKEAAFLCLLAISIFALFSYPLMYPFVWLMLLYSGYLLVFEQIHKVYLYIPKLKLALISIVSCLILYIGVHTYDRINMELKWKVASNLSQLGRTEEALFKYQDIYLYLKTNRYFLYNYSAELYYAGKYQESLNTALQCRKYWADYDVEMLLGTLYEYLQKPVNAEQHYRQASYMCPNRFMPLYRLVILLKQENRQEEVKKMAHDIINKKVKIHSAMILQIKNIMNDLLDKNTI